MNTAGVIYEALCVCVCVMAQLKAFNTKRSEYSIAFEIDSGCRKLAQFSWKLYRHREHGNSRFSDNCKNDRRTSIHEWNSLPNTKRKLATRRIDTMHFDRNRFKIDASHSSACLAQARSISNRRTLKRCRHSIEAVLCSSVSLCWLNCLPLLVASLVASVFFQSVSDAMGKLDSRKTFCLVLLCGRGEGLFSRTLTHTHTLMKFAQWNIRLRKFVRCSEFSVGDRANPDTDTHQKLYIRAVQLPSLLCIQPSCVERDTQYTYRSTSQ